MRIGINTYKKLIILHVILHVKDRFGNSLKYFKYPLAELSERILNPADGLVINLVDVL